MAMQAEIEAAWQVYCSVNPQVWGINHMKAALEAAERVRWQPIDTAPKDGTDFLGYTVDGDMWVMAWNYETEQFESERLFFGAALTHWQPLPSPPD